MRWHSMEKNKYIYYNPTLDLRGIPVSDNLVNISTTMLLYNDLNNSEKLYPYSRQENSTINQIYAFEYMEKERICDFILTFNHCQDFVDFFPTDIKFSVDKLENNSFLKKSYFYGEDLDMPDNKEINDIQLEIDNLESIIFQYYDFEKYFDRKEENSAIRYFKIPLEEQKQLFFRLLFINIFQLLLNDGSVLPNDFMRKFVYHLEDDDLTQSEIEKQLLDLKKKVFKLIDLVDWKEFDFPIVDDYYRNNSEPKERNIYKYLGSIELSISQNKNKIILNEVIASMDSILKGKRIFTYETLNELSSGQKHLLTLYSRFYWAKNKIEKSENKQYGIKGEAIIIYIDEGEVALHPEWQRSFLNKVLKFFNLLFEDYKVQLILTTHSPFVLSDIPKDNVVFLDRDINGNTVISSLENENTFGANIHDLLANNFFLQDGLIGDFAKTKIAITLNWLKIKANEVNKSKKNPNSAFNIDPAIEVIKFESNDEEFTYHKQIINLIGEPLVRNKLLTMYFEYVQEDTYALSSELEKARLRVIELEKRMNS